MCNGENMVEMTANNEPVYRINIKQTAKKMAYFDVSVRANDKENIKKILDDAIEIAKNKCSMLNMNLKEE